MELLVAADDRTGAFETAATLADRLGAPVPVSPWPARSPEAISVIDLGTRHLTPGEARERIADLPTTGRSAHKIDSTLRGNWPDELAVIASHRPVLMIPALPELGRTCSGGVVLAHGLPVHEGHAGSDVRRRVTSSRPAEALAAAGQRVVIELADAASVEIWADAPAGVAVADADDSADIERLVAVWGSRSDDIVLAGTSTVIGAAVPAIGTGTALTEVDGPVLVVCGSVHPVARAQVAAAEREGVPVAVIVDDITARQLASHGELIVVSEIPVGDVDEPMAVAAASSLAAGVADLRGQVQLGALVVVGGDTAAAVLGDRPVAVQGSFGPGTAWLRAHGIPEPVITRSGGFGSERALLDLVRELRRR